MIADTVLIESGTNKQVRAKDLAGLQHHFQPLSGGQKVHQVQPPVQGQQQTIHQPYQPGGQQAQGQQQSQSPYANPPDPISQAYGAQSKSKVAAALLAFLVGEFGLHRFYLGYTKIGILILAIMFVGHFAFGFIGSAVAWVWGIVDGVMILTDRLKDADGYPLT